MTKINPIIAELKSKRLECRVWDIRNEEMIRVDDIQWRDMTEYEVDGIKIKPRKDQPLLINVKSSWRAEDEVIFMWHFGHLDFNKKKVFEGDIIKFCDDGCYYMVAYYDKSSGEFCLMDIEYEDIYSAYDYLGMDGNFNGEVVGNIFQNPELLETEDDEDSAES